MANSETKTIEVLVGRPGRDELTLSLALADGGEIREAKLRAIGCPDLLKLVSDYRSRLKGVLTQVPLPDGQDHAAMLVRECLLRARGEWTPPYTDVELCHCRAVPTAVVDEAIVCGARTVAAVSRKTSAGTSCGTCKTDIEAMLNFRTK